MTTQTAKTQTANQAKDFDWEAGSYWAGNGKHQETYKALKHLVPDRGASEDMNVEVIRWLANTYYDCYNNAGCNLGDARHDQFKSLLMAAPESVAEDVKVLSEWLSQIEAAEEAWNQSIFSDSDDEDDEELDAPAFETKTHGLALENLANAVIERAAKFLLS